MVTHIFLRKINRPRRSRMDDELEWLCESLGFCRGRDIDSISKQIVSCLMNPRYIEEGVTSEELARRLDMPLSRVNHHLRNLIDAGFVYRAKRKIYLRGGSVKSAVEELRKDADRIFNDLEQIAEEMDRVLFR